VTAPSSLPPPPGARLATLPRRPADEPQEAAVALDPADPRRIVVSYHHAVGAGSDHHPGMTVDVHVAWSEDGGSTWAVADRTTHPEYTRSLDATVAFDTRGHAYLAYIGLDRMTMGTRHGQFLSRSLDGGRTWEPPVTLVSQPETEHEPDFDHIPNLVCDVAAESPYGDTVYVVWDRVLGGARGGTMFITRSTDGGETWSEPHAFSTHPTRLAHTTAVASDGTLYVMVAQSTVGVMYARPGEGEWEIVLLASRDGGESFDGPYPVVVSRARPDASGITGFPRQGGWPVMAIDPRGPGRLHAVWGDYRHGDRDLFATASADGGRTWSDPVRVNDDPVGNGRDQVMHWLAVDPSDGAVYVVFYDRRDDVENRCATVTLARSGDGGRTFANYCWSDRAVDPTAACLGDYLGLAALGGRVCGAWVEDVPAPPGAERGVPSPPGPGERTPDEREWPWGTSAIRVGFADFTVPAQDEVPDPPEELHRLRV
jgi:hypothetical protein